MRNCKVRAGKSPLSLFKFEVFIMAGSSEAAFSDKEIDPMTIDFETLQHLSNGAAQVDTTCPLGLTQDRVLSLFLYNPITGTLIRRARAWHCAAGTRAGMMMKSNGYRYVKIDGRRYLEHRVIWFYMTGEWPAENIDHIDGDSANN
jgi:hypothetical protein